MGGKCCHERCSKCHLFDYNMEWHCTECDPGYELWVDGCFLPCPEGQYRYGYKCENCPQYCKRCVGGMKHECRECQDGFLLDFRGVCMRKCPEGEFTNLNGYDCVP